MNNQAILLILTMAMAITGLGLSLVGGTTSDPFVSVMGVVVGTGAVVIAAVAVSLNEVGSDD